MELFNDNLKYATGFVKPKTTSILFEKILISDDLLDEKAARFGYSYIPREVLLENTVIQSPSPKKKNIEKSKDSNIIANCLISGELSSYVSDLSDKINKKYINDNFSIYFRNNIGSVLFADDLPSTSENAPDLDISQKLDTQNDEIDVINYKYSVNRNNGILKAIKRCKSLGIDIVPVYFSPTEFEQQHNHYNNRQKCPTISICINHMPEIIEKKLEWEQVLDIRNDNESIIKVRRLKGWLNTNVLNKTEDEICSTIGKAVEDYSFALKKHGILTISGAISTVSTASVTLINMLTQSGRFDTAGISIASGLTIFAIKSYIDRVETKRHPIALIYDLMK